MKLRRYELEGRKRGTFCQPLLGVFDHDYPGYVGKGHSGLEGDLESAAVRGGCIRQ